MPVTEIGKNVAANAAMGGYLINCSYIGVGTGIPQPGSNIDKLTHEVYKGKVKTTQNLGNGVICYTLTIPKGIPASGVYKLLEYGIYLDTGELFIYDSLAETVSIDGTSDVTILFTIQMQNSEASTVNVTIGDYSDLPTIAKVSQLQDPSKFTQRCLVVLDMMTNSDGFVSPGIAMACGGNNNKWGFTGHNEIFSGFPSQVIDNSTCYIPATEFVPSEIVIVNVSSGNSKGESRKMQAGENGLLKEYDGVPFSNLTKSSILNIWRNTVNKPKLNLSPVVNLDFDDITTLTVLHDDNSSDSINIGLDIIRQDIDEISSLLDSLQSEFMDANFDSIKDQLNTLQIEIDNFSPEKLDDLQNQINLVKNDLNVFKISTNRTLSTVGNIENLDQSIKKETLVDSINALLGLISNSEDTGGEESVPLILGNTVSGFLKIADYDSKTFRYSNEAWQQGTNDKYVRIPLSTIVNGYIALYHPYFDEFNVATRTVEVTDSINEIFGNQTIKLNSIMVCKVIQVKSQKYVNFYQKYLGNYTKNPNGSIFGDVAGICYSYSIVTI